MPSTAAAISPFAAPHVGTILVDSGFYSEAVVQAVERKLEGTPSGVFLLAAVERLSHHRTVADVLPQQSRLRAGRRRARTRRLLTG